LPVVLRVVLKIHLSRRTKNLNRSLPFVNEDLNFEIQRK
jgi:hypothetical protein